MSNGVSNLVRINAWKWQEITRTYKYFLGINVYISP
nr:MAG TPA: hypothetical protein [Caudoviricetes sp.]